MLTLDAFGDNVNYSASVYSCGNNQSLDIAKIASENDFIVGRLYRYITLILGLLNEHEYKVMGMAPIAKISILRMYLICLNHSRKLKKSFCFKNRPRDLYFTIHDALEGQRFDSISACRDILNTYH